MPGTGYPHLRSSANAHVSLTYIYLYVLHLEIHQYLHSCSRMHSWLWSPYAHIHICNCASLRCLCNHICAPYQYIDGLNLCTMHTTQSHHQGPHRYSQPQCHTGRYTYSHHCILTLSYTQPTDPSLTLMYTFSQTQRALVWLHSHCYMQMRISTKALTSLRFE